MAAAAAMFGLIGDRESLGEVEEDERRDGLKRCCDEDQTEKEHFMGDPVKTDKHTVSMGDLMRFWGRRGS